MFYKVDQVQVDIQVYCCMCFQRFSMQGPHLRQRRIPGPGPRPGPRPGPFSEFSESREFSESSEFCEFSEPSEFCEFGEPSGFSGF